MNNGGFIQGLPYPSGYMIPLHEYSMQLPASLDLTSKYRIYEMFSAFVRTQLVFHKHQFIVCDEDELFYTLRVMEYYEHQEDARCKHKQTGNEEYDFYILEDFKIHERQDIV